MHTNSFLTGSSKIVSSLHFLDTGEIMIENVGDQMSPEDTGTLVVTQEYLMYALERDDWMISFLESMKDKANDMLKSQGPSLELLQGGLSED